MSSDINTKSARHPFIVEQLKASQTSPAFKTILYQVQETPKGNIARITLNRPEAMNAFNWCLLNEVTEAVELASVDDSIGVVVVTGAGDRAFCVGADLKEQNAYFLEHPQDYWKWMGAFIEMHDKLRRLNKPTIARLNGAVVGGGNELNMACDLAVAADDIYIKQVGAAHGSVAAGGATQWLPDMVGDRRAREILYLCEEISAPKALEWGLINRCVPRAELDKTVDELAMKLLDKLPESTRYTKTQLNLWREFSWAMTIGHARDWLTLHTGHMETREAIRGFVEKRSIPYTEIRRRWAELDN